MSKNKKSDAKTARVSAKAPEAPKKMIEDRDLAVQRATRETLAVFENQPALTFAFLGGDGTRSIGPNLISPIDLAQCAFQGMDYSGPHPESELQRARAMASGRRDEIVATVKEQVQRLQELGVVFLLLWQAYGESEPHVDYSADFADADVREEIADLLVEEARWMIST